MSKSRIKNIRRASVRVPERQKASKHALDRNIYRLPAWKNVFESQPVFILGNGPSIGDWDLSLLDGFFTIGINRIIDIYEPTILLWQDIAFWKDHSARIKKVKSIKVAKATADPNKIACHYQICGKDAQFSGHPAKLYGYGSSGTLAVQMARAMGCNPCVLLGCDCCHRGEQTDFYGVNKYHQPHSMKNCRDNLKWLREEDHKGSIDVINCSDNKLWPKANLDDVVSELDRYKKDAQYFKSKLLQSRFNKK